MWVLWLLGIGFGIGLLIALCVWLDIDITPICEAIGEICSTVSDNDDDDD